MKQLRWIYGIGIVVDLVAAVALALPSASRVRRLAFPGVDRSNTAFAAGARTAAPLMLGWTALLVWAQRRPTERSGVLLLTAFPVVAGLMVTEFADCRAGYASLARTTPTLLLQATLLAAFGSAYQRAHQLGANRSLGRGRDPVSRFEVR